MTNLTEQQAELLSYVRRYGSSEGLLMGRPPLRK